jgi:copper chaperone
MLKSSILVLLCFILISCDKNLVVKDQQIAKQEIQAAQTISLSISGMDCEGCVKSITEAIQSIDGVEDVVVSLEKGTASIKGSNVELNKLITAIDDAGYGATLLDTTFLAQPKDSLSVK